MHFSPCHDEGDNYRIVVVRHKVLEIRLGEGDVSIGDMIFHRVNSHHRPSIPLPLRGCTPPSREASRDRVHLPVHWYLVLRIFC